MDKNALIIHGDEALRDLCAGILKTLGYTTEVADSATRALALLEDTQIDVVLTGVEVPGSSGVELLRDVKRLSPDTDVVMMADSGTIPDAVEAIKLGAYDYISNLGQPFKADDLKHLLGRLAERQQLASENRLLREEVGTVQGFGSLIGASEVMQAVYRTILRVAGKRLPISAATRFRESPAARGSGHRAGIRQSDWRFGGDAGSLSYDSQSGGQAASGADSGRERDGQGTGGARHPCL